MSRVVGLKAPIYTCCRIPPFSRISLCFYMHLSILSVLPLIPCTALSRLPPTVLSRTGGLRGLPPIGWPIRCGPSRPVPSSYSHFGLVFAHGPVGWGLIGVRSSCATIWLVGVISVLIGVCCWGSLGQGHNLR